MDQARARSRTRPDQLARRHGQEAFHDLEAGREPLQEIHTLAEDPGVVRPGHPAGPVGGQGQDQGQGEIFGAAAEKDLGVPEGAPFSETRASPSRRTESPRSRNRRPRPAAGPRTRPGARGLRPGPAGPPGRRRAPGPGAVPGPAGPWARRAARSTGRERAARAPRWPRARPRCRPGRPGPRRPGRNGAPAHGGRPRPRGPGPRRNLPGCRWAGPPGPPWGRRTPGAPAGPGRGDSGWSAGPRAEAERG
jgi:hypothetical protein